MKKLVKLFKMTRGEEKIKVGRKILRELAKFSYEEPFWKAVTEKLGISERDVKDIMLFLEDAGVLRIRKSRDGRRLYVLTLRELREHPVTLDKWLG
ncbi:hypothetical protein [Pyrococcus yayanosii]|uniref:ArsR family transcriptional regulator n=1 Tax=Pyrococcus yayanosii (strain CH1 / JCM 16557) TaxID=529709 RepID=F8AEB5_PYRYC|nr:hypothetical protein [Pyrococcus yayanosii]AEH24627.1 hypothetical protein PYCH_09420 [Pyrococcus yayanosii CH1]